MTAKQEDEYTVRPFPKMRRFSLDAGRLGRHRHTIHGLLEMDVTEPRRYIREAEARTGEEFSFTAFIITCLAKAVAANPEVQAYRNWRNQLVIYKDVNVNTMVEIEVDGRRVPMPYVLRAVNRKTFLEVHQEIRSAQRESRQRGEPKHLRLLLTLPWPLRRVIYWVAMRNPQWTRKFQSSVLVTAVGMFGKGGGWGIPVASFALVVTLGGIAEKPGVVNGRIEVREYLSVTVSFDHDIIDGAPAARFTKEFRELVESGYGLVV